MQKQLITFRDGRLSILIEISEQTKTALGEGPSKGARISMNGSSRHPCHTVLPQGNPDQSQSTLSRRYRVCQRDSRSHPRGSQGKFRRGRGGGSLEHYAVVEGAA